MTVQLFSLERLWRDTKARLTSHHRLGALEVELGQPRTEHTTITSNRVIFREAEGGDAWEANQRHAAGNPAPAALRMVGAVVTIEGVSRAAGALPRDHRRVVTVLLHAVVEAMLTVASQNRIPVALTGGGFVDDDDDSVEHGARYELAITLPEQVSHAPYDLAEAGETGIPYDQSGTIVIDGVDVPAC